MSDLGKPGQPSLDEQIPTEAVPAKDSPVHTLGSSGATAAAGQPSTTGSSAAGSVTSALGDAWESVKEATGIATTKTNANLDEKKAEADVKADNAKYVTSEVVKDAREALANKIEPSSKK